MIFLALALLAQRAYWPVPLDSLAIGHTVHTHVAVRGVVTLVGHEDDQDLHVRLTAPSGRFIVAECIPELPCKLPNGLPWIPALGDTVTVYGISRYDPEHKWYEVHIVEGVLP